MPNLTRFIAPENDDWLFGLASPDSLPPPLCCCTNGGVGKPGVGIASSGTLVGGGGFRLSRFVERDDAEELDGESSVDGVGGVSSPVPIEDPRFLPSNLGLGAALTRGLGIGVFLRLYIPSVPMLARVEKGGLKTCRRKLS